MNFSHCENDKIKQFRLMVEKSDNIAIIAHVGPDGDAVGSVLGMYNTLKKQGKKVTALFPDAFPKYYRFLPASDEIVIAENDSQKAADIVGNADLLILQDLNETRRVGALQQEVENSPSPKILIDHHLQPDTEPFDLIFSEPEISSASELVFWILAQAFGIGVIDSDIATCLYTGICTDTGSFAYSCNQKSVYLAVSELVDKGIDIKAIHDEVFNTFSADRLKFIGHCINGCMHIMEDVPIAYFVASYADQRRFNLKDGDMEGVVNYALMMEEIEVGAMLKETGTGEVRISFRSKHDFDVSSFARTYFNGGGHQKASGATSKCNLEETEKLLAKHLREEYKKHVK